jgi:uncharacterized cupredoxin-like copper-binding protein
MAGGSAASFEEFFEAERVRLYRVLFAITGSRPEAEDISQDAFLRVWERWERVREMDDPAGYLHRTAVNVFGLLQAGENGSITFTADEAGSYFYICSEFGHVPRGMFGEFVVA